MYRGHVRAVKGPFRDPHMQRCVVLLIFDVMPEINLLDVLAQVQMYFNLGKGDKPKAGRRSKYFHTWCMAIGGHMRRGDRMTPRASRLLRVALKPVRHRQGLLFHLLCYPPPPTLSSAPVDIRERIQSLPRSLYA